MTLTSPNPIEIKQLSFYFEGETRSQFDEIDFTLSKGDCAFLLGPSGSGKSTLALCLNKLYPEGVDGVLEGTILVNGKNIDSFKTGEINKKIGMVFQDPESQFCMLTVEEELAFGLENIKLPSDVIAEKIDIYLELVGLSAYKNAMIHTLSGGQKQKLALACVLSMGPEILILDEPTANLDPASSLDLVATIKEIQVAHSLTLLVIEHRLDDWIELVNTCIVLNSSGRILFNGHPRQCFTDYSSFLQEEGIWLPNAVEAGMVLANANVYKCPQLPFTEKELLAGVLIKQEAIELLNRRTNLEVTEFGKELLRVEGLSCRVGGKQLLTDIDFSIREGEFVAVLGENGSGKSTFSKAITGLLPNSDGTITVDGRKIENWPERELWNFIGYVFQNPEHQFITDSVLEEISFGLRLLYSDEEEIHERLQKILSKTRLQNHIHYHPFNLSQGQKRRLSVATMLMQDQKILILDEPTFGQDAITAREIMQLAKETTRDSGAVMMITHDMELVHEYADRVCLIDEGRILFSGPPENLWENKRIIEKSRIRPPFTHRLRDLCCEEEISLEVT